MVTAKDGNIRQLPPEVVGLKYLSYKHAWKCETTLVAEDSLDRLICTLLPPCQPSPNIAKIPHHSISEKRKCHYSAAHLCYDSFATTKYLSRQISKCL